MFQKVGTYRRIDIGTPFKAVFRQSKVQLTKPRKTLRRTFAPLIAQCLRKLCPTFMVEILLCKQHPVDDLTETQTTRREVLTHMKQQHDTVNHGRKDRKLVTLHASCL